jgi:hypothetical protein
MGTISTLGLSKRLLLSQQCEKSRINLNVDFFEQGIGAAFGEQALKRTRTAEAV